LLNTFELIPEYLKTRHDGETNDYSNWGIQLGRRFRALKLWFVIRSYGVEGLQAELRRHITLGQDFYKKVSAHNDFEVLAPVPLNVTCFRYKPASVEPKDLNALNEKLLAEINKDGRIYLTHTVLNGNYCLRFVAGQTNLQQKHIDIAWEHIQECCRTV
jgi:aromatic-L-amino-acid/L-tryptophan decarboxylase